MNLSSIVPVRRIPRISDATSHTTIKASTPRKIFLVPDCFISLYSQKRNAATITTSSASFMPN